MRGILTATVCNMILDFSVKKRGMVNEKNSCVWVFLLGTFIVWTFSYFWVAYTSMSEFIHISSADINNAGKILRLVSVFKKNHPTQVLIIRETPLYKSAVKVTRMPTVVVRFEPNKKNPERGTIYYRIYKGHNQAYGVFFPSSLVSFFLG